MSNKKVKIIVLAISIGLLAFMLIIGALLGGELVMTGNNTELLCNCVDYINTKVFSYNENISQWEIIEGQSISIDTVQNNSVIPNRYSEVNFTLSNNFGKNEQYTLVDCGFYVLVDMNEGESKNISFILEYGPDKVVSTTATVNYSSDEQKGKGIVKFTELYCSMKDITNLNIKLDCTELNETSCISWTFQDIQISYNYS